MNKPESIDYIEHTAIVRKVDAAKDVISVVIADNNECHGCPAARLCSGAGEEEMIEISTPRAGSYKTGDEIFIRGTEQMERRAIMLATVLPCVILVAIMVGIYLLTANQALAALCGVGAMIVFFAALYLCRDRIAHEFVFTITDKN